MTKITTVLFDFDGVIANTEPQYDIFIDGLGEKYNLGIKNFALQVKGTTTPDILKKYFSHFPEETLNTIREEFRTFELQMGYPLIDGVNEFIDYLKKSGYKIGLVTSSQDFKMERALDLINMSDTFDVEITAARITTGKPDPMCYLLAAKDLNVKPEECIVFEDSFHGIQSGKSAGMKVVGLSTTIPESDLKKVVDDVIPDFSDLQKVIKFLE